MRYQYVYPSEARLTLGWVTLPSSSPFLLPMATPESLISLHASSPMSTLVRQHWDKDCIMLLVDVLPL